MIASENLHRDGQVTLPMKTEIMVVIDVLCAWHCFYSSVWLRLISCYFFYFFFFGNPGLLDMCLYTLPEVCRSFFSLKFSLTVFQNIRCISLV